MTDDEIATLMNDTAGQHWGDEAHFQRFAVALEKRFTAANMPAIKMAMQAERQNGAIEERRRCVQIAYQWDVAHPSTNFGGCVARLIKETAP